MEEHYRRNRRPRIPDPKVLAQIARRSEQTDDAATIRNDGDSANEYESGRVKHRRPATQPSPSSLGFYPPMWRDFLDDCKIEARTYLATHNPFPSRREAVATTGFILECVNLTFATWKDEKKKLEKGYYPKFKNDMVKLVSARNRTGYVLTDWLDFWRFFHMARRNKEHCTHDFFSTLWEDANASKQSKVKGRARCIREKTCQ